MFCIDRITFVFALYEGGKVEMLAQSSQRIVISVRVFDVLSYGYGHSVKCVCNTAEAKRANCGFVQMLSLTKTNTTQQCDTNVWIHRSHTYCTFFRTPVEHFDHLLWSTNFLHAKLY